MKILQNFALYLLIACGISATAAPAFAATHHHTHKTAHKKSSSDILRDAQKHLINLGYYTARADGLMGPKTKAALKAFQQEFKLHITGTLTAETRRALVDADKARPTIMAAMPLPVPPPPEDFYAKHPDFYGHVNQDYADPMQRARANPGSAQALPNRFTNVSMSEASYGAGRQYNVMINGQPILQANNQPSVIGVSQTFNLGNEDAIIFSTTTPPIMFARPSIICWRCVIIPIRFIRSATARLVIRRIRPITYCSSRFPRPRAPV